jgi:hypothetical protein
MAENLLQYEKTLEVVGKRNLIDKCELSSIVIAIDVLKIREDIFTITYLNKLAMRHLSNSRFHTSKILQMIYVSGGAGKWVG